MISIHAAGCMDIYKYIYIYYMYNISYRTRKLYVVTHLRYERKKSGRRYCSFCQDCLIHFVRKVGIGRECIRIHCGSHTKCDHNLGTEFHLCSVSAALSDCVVLRNFYKSEVDCKLIIADKNIRYDKMLVAR
jgi:hypothetical protein